MALAPLLSVSWAHCAVHSCSVEHLRLRDRRGDASRVVPVLGQVFVVEGEHFLAGGRYRLPAILFATVAPYVLRALEILAGFPNSWFMDWTQIFAALGDIGTFLVSVAALLPFFKKR